VVEARKEVASLANFQPVYQHPNMTGITRQKIIFDATRAIENLIYRYSSQFGTFLHQDREKLRLSTREYVLYVSW
jgi:hypothetical protein